MSVRRADGSDPVGPDLAAHTSSMRGHLLAASADLEADGVPGTDGRGSLIRPLVALAAVGAGETPPAGFWHGVLAVQLAHEASLVHDDVLDGATERRGEATVVAARGVAHALLRGDHLLTAAYRAAARTKNLDFVTLFARCVERTVAGEAEQGRAAGRALTYDRYADIVRGKSGELFGCALSTASILAGRSDAAHLFDVGRAIGLLYQVLDDLLDYCPLADTGKPALGDYTHGRWTWVLDELDTPEFGAEAADILDRLHADTGGGSPLLRALGRFEREAASLRVMIHSADLDGNGILAAMLDGWLVRARSAVRREAAARGSSGSAVIRGSDFLEILRERVPDDQDTVAYFAANSRSFRFASRLFAPADADRVARVYAFCRITDDLTDHPPPGVDVEGLLDAWLTLARRAYHDEPSGLQLLDLTMREMADARVPFTCAAELVEGMRMDLHGVRYDTFEDLRRYTYRVAAVVGVWLTRMFGVQERSVLEAAERMGHAMQLTNILRDVGEDWRRGRLYLPAALLDSHGVSRADIGRMCDDGPTPRYRLLIEELMAVAESDYAAGLLAVPSLPSSFGRPVAVAAYVYRGIHREIRRRGYDNLRQRAYTDPLTKGVLAAHALWRFHRGTDEAAAIPASPGGLVRSG